MIQITTEDGKYFFSEFVNIIEEQTEEIDENTLTLVDLQYILLAYKTERITLSEGDLLKVNNKIEELSSTGSGLPDLSDYVTKQELIEEVFKLRGDLGEEITMESISQSLTEIETKIEEVPENLSTTVTELQTFKSTVETDYTKKTDLDSYATLEHFDTLVNNLIFLATDKANEAVAKVVNGAPATFDTLKEIATWIENDGVGASDLAASISGKADKLIEIPQAALDVPVSMGIPLYTLDTGGNYVLCEPDSWVDIGNGMCIPAYIKSKLQSV